MTVLADPIQAKASVVRAPVVAVVFTATIFLSATLLFSVQPMFTKLILPLLGGAPNVWNTAMAFFQALLLGGYVYAHLSSKYLSLRVQIGVHLAITALGLAFLPLAVGDVTVPETSLPVLWLFGLFFATVGMPFFALSANAPLLQRWFSLTDHKDAQDPYFLYSASNAGSLLILCAYPVVIEPFISLGGQTHLWMLGYVFLLLALGGAGFAAKRHFVVQPSSSTLNTNLREDLPGATGWRTVLFWSLLAFIPSSLMLGVTSFVTNNIASVPLLWIVPLALYLLTFVIAFSRRQFLASSTLGRVTPWVILVNLGVISVTVVPVMVMILTCLISFFVICLYCHLRLVEDRPNASRLTQFYIIMAFGGVLGGLFTAMVAPALFVDTYEYFIVLLLAATIVPKNIALLQITSDGVRKFLMTLAFALVAGFAFMLVAEMPTFGLTVMTLLGYLAFRYLEIWRPFGVTALIVLLAAPFLISSEGTMIYQGRSFFSTIKVEQKRTSFGLMHEFSHGDTVHNFQLRDPTLRHEPTSYYARGGSFDVMLQSVRNGDRPLAVSLIGMGAGAMSCYEEPGDQWTYFEIDPAVVKMALNPDLFSYLADCSPNADIRIGDARLKLADLKPASQDLIIVDAFSSNAIPAHLITREAVEFYRSRLTPDGVIFFHTSNRFLDVSSVVARVAEDAGLTARFIDQSFDGPKAEYAQMAAGLLVGPPAVIHDIASDPKIWSNWVPSPQVRVWTDDYSSVLATLRAKMLRNGSAEPIGSDL